MQIPNAKSRAGMTLVELLLAAAVSLLIITTVLTLYTTAVGRSGRRNLTSPDFSIAMEILARDLNCVLVVSGATQDIFSLKQQNNEKTAVLECFTAVPSARESSLKFYDIVEAHYFLRKEPAGFFSLYRKTRPFIAGENKEFKQERLCRGLDKINISLFDGNSWTNRWRASPSDPMPQAVELSLLPAGHKTPVRSFTLIPAGLPFEGQ